MKQMIKKMAVVLSVALVCAPMGAMATDKLLVQDSSSRNKFVVSDTTNTITIKNAANADKIILTDTGRIGVGGVAPKVSVHTQGSGWESTQILSHYVGTNVVGIGKSGAGGFLAYRNNVSTTNNSLPTSGDRIGYFLFGSYATDGVSQKNAAGISAYAEADWTASTMPAYYTFELAGPTGGRSERMRINSTGSLGIGTTAPKSKLHVVGILEYSDNTAAMAAGLTAGAIYRTGDILKIVH